MTAKNSTGHQQAARTSHRLPRVCYLKSLSSDTTGKVFSLSAKTVIGRRSDCDIVIASKGISRQHATIVEHGNGFLLTDLDSANGTFVNGKRINSVLLESGDEITFDNTRFLFKTVAAPGAVEDSGASPDKDRRAAVPVEVAVTRLEQSAAQRALTAGISVVLAVLVFLLIWSMFI